MKSENLDSYWNIIEKKMKFEIEVLFKWCFCVEII